MDDQHKLLVKVQKQLIQLQSNDPNQRYTACEELRLLPSLPDHALDALRETTNDPNRDVADAAGRAYDLHTLNSEAGTIVVNSKDRDFSQQEGVAKMYKSIRSWAILSVIVGGTSLVAGGTVDPVWGIVLIVTGVLSWRIKIPQMYVIYSVIMGWAAIGNGLAVISGESVWWLALALLQVYFVFIIIRDYRKYRQLRVQELYEEGNWPDELAPPQNEKKIVDRFALSSLIAGVGSIVIMSVTFMGCLILLFITEASAPFPEWLFFVGLGAVNIAVLALGMGCAAVVSKSSRRGIAIAGVVVCSLVLIGYIGFILLSVLVDEAIPGSYPITEATASIIPLL